MNLEPKKSGGQPRPSLRSALKSAPRHIVKFLYHNWPWKLLAVFLAVCLWAGLISQDATLTRERVFNDVAISVTGADTLRRNSGLIVLSGLEEDALSVRLHVNVPQREYNSVSASYYNPRVDLTRITGTGEQTLKINTTSTSTYGAVRAVTPETITVVVDEYVTNYRVPVSINQTGEYPEGYYGAAPTANPSVVALSGPKSLVDHITRICVDFDASLLAAKEGKVRTALPMRFLTASGEEVESSLLEVTSADVLLRTIIVEQELYPTRTIPLSDAVLTEGEPALGYQLKGVTASPSVLLAAGDAEELSAVETLFIDEPVDITDRDESFTVEVRVKKPAELEYLSANTITLTVEIVPVTVSRTFDGIKLYARGIGQGLSTKLSVKTLSVALTGPQLVVNNLRSANLSGYVDVSGLEAGEYELPVQLHVEDRDMSELSYTITPATVLVTLE